MVEHMVEMKLISVAGVPSLCPRELARRGSKGDCYTDEWAPPA